MNCVILMRCWFNEFLFLVNGLLRLDVFVDSFIIVLYVIFYVYLFKIYLLILM